MSKALIHGQAWDYADIAKDVAWCKEQNWQYQQYVIEDDHDHCEICYWTIFLSEDVESGFAYQSNNCWVCQECYDNFISK